MKKTFLIPALGTAVAVWSPLVAAREVVVLPGVVSPVGVLSGVDTQGPGGLTVGSQNINTSNDAGGAITTSAANTANVVFMGTSNVTGFVGATGSSFLNISAGTNANTVTFSGPVYATTFTVAGAGTVNFNGGFVSNTGSTMDFAGDGFINVGAGQTVKAAITNSAGARTGTLTLNGNSILDGAAGAASGLKEIRLTGGNALITGEANAGIYTLGTNTLNVAGAYAIPTGGVINTTIFSQSLYGKIVPVGAATIGNALQVNVVVTGPIANGSIFNIVDATSGTDGSTVTATDNSARYLFSAAPTTGGRVVIVTTQIPLVDIVTPVVTPPVTPPVVTPPVTPPVVTPPVVTPPVTPPVVTPPVVTPPVTPPIVAPPLPPIVNPVVPIIIAPVVDALPITATTSPVLVAISLLPTAPAIASALAQLAPSTTNLAAPRVAYRTTQRFQDIMGAHLACGQLSQRDRADGVQREDLSACQPEDQRSRLWGAAFGQFAEQGNVQGFEGYDSDVLGGMIAYDALAGDTTRAGVGVRYARSSLDGKASESQTDIKSYQVAAYLAYTPGDWFANATLVYGLDRYEGSRRVAFPGVDATVAAKFKGHQYTASGVTGYNFPLGDGLTVLTPQASLQYTRLHTKGYTETGADAINLRVNAKTYEFTQAGLGAKIARSIPISNGQVMRPDIHVNWLHSLGGETMSNVAAFASGGPAFLTMGLKPKRDTFNVGTGVVFANSGAWSIEAVYDYQWRADSFKAHQAMIKFAVRM